MNGKVKVFLVSVVLFFLAASLPTLAQPYPTVSIHDLQFVPDPATNDQSAFFGDTVVVQGLVMHGPRDLWVGNRWAVHIIDPNDFPNPWSGFFIIQHDTLAITTNFGFVEPGMIVKFTGVVDEFANFSQVFLLVNPPTLTPIEIVSVGNPLPGPLTLTAADLTGPAVAEQWESMFIQVNDATIINNSIAGNWASYNDASGGPGYIAEYFNWFRDRLNAGTYSWPSNGTAFNVTGFIRDESGSPGRVFSINPRDTLDVTVLGDPPPVIIDSLRNPGAPTSADNVDVRASINDNVSVQSATLHYSVDEGPFQQTAMAGVSDIYTGTIPAQANGAFVRYFITAMDNSGGQGMAPGDTSRASGQVFFYVVRDGGMNIADVQFTHGYFSDISGYAGYEVTLQGVVMTDSTDRFGDYWIQDAAAAWAGIWVNDGTFTHVKGDEVAVTATVEENFGVTRMNNVTSSNLVTPGVGEFSPVDVTTGEINTGGANTEIYESVLVRVQNAQVTDPFPDDPSNFGEFTVDDATGGLRVDDFMNAFRGNLDSTFALGDVVTVTGFGYFSFGNAKLIPRDSTDVVRIVGIGDDETAIPGEFSLAQNYPNPFNPSTDIRYNIAKAGKYRLTIYNILGQKILVLKDAQHDAGQHQLTWKGQDISGNQVGSGIYFYRLTGNNVSLTKKMILLR